MTTLSRARRLALAWSASCLVAATLSTAVAIDISPSKTTADRKTFDTGGGGFSIFKGDPARIQRANAIDFKNLEVKLEMPTESVSLQALKDGGSRPALKITFSVRNKGKKLYTLSFPNAQRYDIAVQDAAGTVVYMWSSDKIFTEDIGAAMLNPDDKIAYKEAIALEDFTVPLVPGTYTVTAVMANYSELTAKKTLTVTP